MSPILRTRGDLVRYAGFWNIAKIDTTSMDLLWHKEHQFWGTSSSITYKNWGVGDFNLFVGGAHDHLRFDDSSAVSKWRLGFIRVNENGETTADTTFHGYGSVDLDISAEAPTVDRLYIEDTFGVEE